MCEHKVEDYLLAILSRVFLLLVKVPLIVFLHNGMYVDVLVSLSACSMSSDSTR